jgi:sarcosine oxidase subunit beta
LTLGLGSCHVGDFLVSEPSMQKSADVVIVGGGIVGVSVAYHAARARLGTVALLEKGLLGEGTTGKCLGGIRTQFSTDIHVAFSIESLRFFEHFEEEFGVDPQFCKCGYLFLISREDTMNLFLGSVELLKERGIPVECLSVGEIARRWPYLSVGDLCGGTFSAFDGFAGPHEVLQGLVRRARQLGVEVYQNTEVVGIEVRGGQVRSVRTTGGTMETRCVVNAAGPHAREVGRMVSVEIPVAPFRRQIFATCPFPLIDGLAPITIDFDRGWYFKQEGSQLLLAGPKDEKSGFNTQVDWGSLEFACANALHRVPRLKAARIMKGWAGLYAMTPDGHAIVGSAPELEGFVCASGMSGHGFMHSPVVGRVVAELITHGKATSLDIAPLSLKRFYEGRLNEEPLTAFSKGKGEATRVFDLSR